MKKKNKGHYNTYEDTIILAEYNKGIGYVKRIMSQIDRTEQSIRNRLLILRKNNKAKAVDKLNIEIYLITTLGCQACVIQDRIISNFKIKYPNKFNYIKCNFLDAPTFIKINVKLEDYPVTVIIKDNTIKYHFAGTKSIRELEQIFKDLKL